MAPKKRSTKTKSTSAGRKTRPSSRTITATKKKASKVGARATAKKAPASKARVVTKGKKSAVAKGPAKKKAASRTSAKRAATSRKPAATKLATAKKKAAKSTSSTRGAVKRVAAKKKVVAKKSVAKTLSGRSGATTRAPKKPKTASAADLGKFRSMLVTIRHRLMGDVNMMSQEALGGSDAAADNHAPIHPAEVGTHSFEQEFTLNLLSSDGDRLEQIEAALEKIDEGTYGACDECGGRIPKARLEVIPDTPFCVKCASRLEG